MTSKLRIDEIVDSTDTGSPAFPLGVTTTALSYTGTLTGSTGVINIGAGQIYKDADGNVGIGTSSPSAQLDVRSASGIAFIIAKAEGTTASDSAILRLSIDGTVAESLVQFGDADDSNVGQIRYDHATDFMSFTTNASERARIDSSGNIGIGTSSPSERLDVNGAVNVSGRVDAALFRPTEDGSASSPVITVGLDNDNGFYRPSGNTIGFTTGGTERARIDDTGGVAIGRTTADEQLHVAGGIRSQSYMTAPTSDTGGYTFTNREDVRIVSLGLNSMSILADNQQRMRILSDGTFLFNSDSPNRTDFGLKFLRDSTTSTILAIDRQSNNGNVARFGRGGNAVGSISVTASSTSYNTSSDYRLKEDAQPVLNPIDRLMQLKPINFAWKVDGTRVDGFLAHEAQAVVPEAVTGEKDAVDAEGKPEYQGIDQSKLVPLLTAAVQELKAELDTVKAELNTLKGN